MKINLAISSLRCKFLLLVALLCGTFSFSQETKPSLPDYNTYPVYQGSDLGLTFSNEQFGFKIWAPQAQAIEFRIYPQWDSRNTEQVLSLARGKNGVWSSRFNRTYAGKFYALRIKENGAWLPETLDPYAKAVTANGHRAAFVDPARVNPEGWEKDQQPGSGTFADAMIYEMHIRDFTSHPSSGVQHRGKYLGLTETGTRSPEGEATGLDHLADLGVSHVQLMPSYDFRSVDELAPDGKEYNWGYDPQNYFVPEGWYASDPRDPTARIREYKAMVKALHDQGIRVIMDVVFNHTGYTDESVFNRCVPGYYYRHWEDGRGSDAAGCGNETASERPMMRKLILDCVKYWIEEYHIDGFRFDLMGIHDIETMNLVRKVADETGKDILIFGEGWAAGGSPLPEEQRAVKRLTRQLDRIGAFSDDIRDGIKGHWADHHDRGFVSGKRNTEESLKFGVVGSTQHPQLDYIKVNYSDKPWANEPFQAINYVACHDDLCLLDKLKVSVPDADEELLGQMHRLANAIVFTSQGIPFLHSGAELMRSKQGDHNSYKSGDAINQIDWSLKASHRRHYQFYRDLVQLRKNHPAFRLGSQSKVAEHLVFDESQKDLFLSFALKNNAGGDDWDEIRVYYNGNKGFVEVPVAGEGWKVVMFEDRVDEEGLFEITDAKVSIPGKSALIIAKN